MNNLQHYFKAHKSILLTLLVSGILGGIVFIALFGVAVVNPMYVDWLRGDGGDLSQHFIGWLFYRQSDWSPILGSINTLAYPHGIAVTFMDAIPLFAIPFKFLSPLLPETFQYFGIWGLMSYILMGSFGGLILHHLTKNARFAIVGSLIFSLSPIVAQRMFAHTALAGQWIILVGIFLLLRLSKQSRLSRFIIAWALVMSVSAAIHPYFIPMSGALMLMSAVLTFQKVSDLIARILAPLAAGIVTFVIIGGFTVTEVATGGAREFGVNLNTLFNSMGWSVFLERLPSTKGTYEGFAYLGLGIIALLGMAGLLFIIAKRPKGFRLKERVKTFFKSRWFVVVLIGVGLLVAALSPTINAGSDQIALYLPTILEKIWSVFRATGRLFWPLYYLLLVGILFVFYLYTKKRLGRVMFMSFFSLFVLIQAVDIIQSPNAQTKHTVLSRADVVYSSSIDEAHLEKVKGSRTHIQYVGQTDNQSFFALAYFGAAHHMTISDGYFSRSPYKAITRTSLQARQDLLQGKGQSDTVYVTRDPEVVEFALGSDTLSAYQEGTEYIITTKPSS